MMFHRIASALLGYPDAELRAALPDISAAITASDVTGEEKAEMDRLIALLSLGDPILAEEDYVRTFDMVPEHSLHLTHHLIGEDKNRGPALIDLAEYYKEYGVEVAEKELPDYLPLMLEFVSVLEDHEGKMFLSRWNKVLRQLHANLISAGSTYAGLVGLVEARSRLVEASGEVDTPPAEKKSDPFSADGDFDPPILWNSPQAGGTPACGSSCGA